MLLLLTVWIVGNRSRFSWGCCGNFCWGRCRSWLRITHLGRKPDSAAQNIINRRRHIAIQPNHPPSYLLGHALLIWLGSCHWRHALLLPHCWLMYKNTKYPKQYKQPDID